MQVDGTHLDALESVSQAHLQATELGKITEVGKKNLFIIFAQCYLSLNLSEN